MGKEDIESLGFKLTIPYDDESFTIDEAKFNRYKKGNVRILHFHLFNRLELKFKRSAHLGYKTYFLGTINSKSELIKILKQTGLNYE